MSFDTFAFRHIYQIFLPILNETSTTLSRKSVNDIPYALADFGTRLVAVIPGAVFASSAYTSPSSVTRKSIRLYERHPRLYALRQQNVLFSQSVQAKIVQDRYIRYSLTYTCFYSRRNRISALCLLPEGR